jgi:hypothetical protein
MTQTTEPAYVAQTLEERPSSAVSIPNGVSRFVRAFDVGLLPQYVSNR